MCANSSLELPNLLKTMAEEPTQQKQIGLPGGPQFPQGIPILPEEKSVYFNGFAIGVGGSDVVLTLVRNGVPIQTLNASFTVAKTLGESIVTAIQQLERNTNHQIMTVQEVAAGTQKSKPPHGTN